MYTHPVLQSYVQPERDLLEGMHKVLADLRGISSNVMGVIGVREAQAYANRFLYVRDVVVRRIGEAYQEALKQTRRSLEDCPDISLKRRNRASMIDGLVEEHTSNLKADANAMTNGTWRRLRQELNGGSAILTPSDIVVLRVYELGPWGFDPNHPEEGLKPAHPSSQLKIWGLFERGKGYSLDEQVVGVPIAPRPPELSPDYPIISF